MALTMASHVLNLLSGRCINVYVCVYIYIYVCVYVYIYVYMYIYVCVYIYIYIVCIYLYLFIYLFIYLFNYLFIYLSIYLYIYIYCNYKCKRKNSVVYRYLRKIRSCSKYSNTCTYVYACLLDGIFGVQYLDDINTWMVIVSGQTWT